MVGDLIRGWLIEVMPSQEAAVSGGAERSGESRDARCQKGAAIIISREERDEMRSSHVSKWDSFTRGLLGLGLSVMSGRDGQ